MVDHGLGPRLERAGGLVVSYSVQKVVAVAGSQLDGKQLRTVPIRRHEALSDVAYALLVHDIGLVPAIRRVVIRGYQKLT